MKVGLLLARTDPFDTVRYAIKHEFELVEIALENWIDSLSRAQMEEIYHQCQDHNIKLAVHAPSSDLHLGSSNVGIRNESIRQIHRAIKLTGGFAQYITIHTGYIPRFRQIGTLERVIDAIRILVEASHKCSLTLCIENVHETSIDQLLDYIRLTNHDGLKLTLDLAHMQIYTNYQPAVAIRVLAPYIGAIHMSDNDGKNDLHLPLGAGRLSFRDSLTALMRIDYCSGLVIEVMNVEDAIRSRSHLTNLIQEVLEEGSQGAGEIQTEKINGG